MVKKWGPPQPGRKREVRIQYLEKLAQSNLFGLNLLASLGEQQHDATLAGDPARILELSREHLNRLLDFQVMAFLEVDETDNNFLITEVEPEEDRSRVEKEINQQIENGGFAWAVNQNRPVVVRSGVFGKSLILHVIATKSRVRGMFAGILSREDKKINQSILYPLSIIMQNTAYALESAALYKMISDQNKNLETTVQERTQDLEEQAHELKQEIAYRRLAEQSLMVAKEEAETAARVKSDFIANISHEFRTPLNAILGYCEILQYESRKIGRQDFQDDLKSIETSGNHLLVLLNDILDLSKIQAGKMDVDLENFKVSDLIDEVMGTIRPLARKNRNTLNVTCQGTVDSMFSDQARLRQVLLNLLSNACKFTEDGGITLKVSGISGSGPDRMVFSVSDTGIGIRPDVLPTLFQEFTQAESSSTRKYGGTGLGLAISRRLCHILGGDISVSSEPGKGSVFTIELPVDATLACDVETSTSSPQEMAEPEAAGVDASAPPSPESLASANGNAATRVLVIDDDPAIRDLIKRFLEKEGFWVETAENGPQGLQKARETHPDIITLDVMMPGMDGWTVLSHLKSDPSLSPVPVLMLTMLDEREKALKGGAADFMNKPVDWDHFVEAILRIRRSPAGSPSILVVEDDLTNRGALTRLLGKEGWKVFEALDGGSALEILATESPDLILLDLVMPEFNGFEFLSHFHANGRNKDIPVIVLTAKELSRQELERLAVEVDFVFQKGDYTRAELMEKIRELLREKNLLKKG